MLNVENFPWMLNSAVLAAAVIYPQFISSQAAIGLTVFLILLIGIPHGAIDHVLYENCARNLPRKSGIHIAADHILYFYWNYLMIMAIWAAVWITIPEAALLSFLVVSAYHFGEGDLNYFKIHNQTLNHILYFSRGLFIILQVASSHLELTNPILIRLVDFPVTDVLETHATLIYLMTVLQHFFVLICLFFSKEHQASAKREVAKASLLFVTFQTTDPLIAFAVYFGVWHSFESIIDEIKFLKNSVLTDFESLKSTGIRHKIVEFQSTNPKIQPFSSGDENVTLNDIFVFYKMALPFTMLAISGMSFLAYVQITWPMDFFSGADLWAAFIVFISILTAPHVWILQLIRGNCDSWVDPMCASSLLLDFISANTRLIDPLIPQTNYQEICS